jgi:hypothetical protein
VNIIQTTTRTPNCYESNMWREHDKLCHTAVHSAILSPHHLPCAITIEQMHDCRTLSNFPNIEQMDKKLLNSASKHRLLPDCHTISTCTPNRHALFSLNPHRRAPGSSLRNRVLRSAVHRQGHNFLVCNS